MTKGADPHTWRTKLLVYSIYAAFLIAMLSLWAGCRQIRTVRVPAGESTIRVEVPDDTARVGEIPPIKVRGSVTMPEEVVIFRDTPDVTVDLSWLEVDRRDPEDQTVSVRTQEDSQTVERTYELPAVGEGLRLSADSAGDLQGRVPGAPADYEVEADVSEIEPPWWRKTWTMMRLVLAFAGGIAFGYVATKLIPFL